MSGPGSSPPTMSDRPANGDGTITWAELAAAAELSLAPLLVEAAGREARWMCEEASGFAAGDWLLGSAQPATQRGVAHLDAMLDRRLAGEPLQYVLGHWPFRGLDLAVDSRALIPRPETEGLVDVVLSELDRVARVGGPQLVADLGTGTGAIAIAVATERPDALVWAVERSPGAVSLARANVAGAGLVGARLRLVQGSWFEPLDPGLAGGFAVVVSNPPYVAVGDPVDEVTGWEPPEALWSGIDGLDAIGELLAEVGDWLCPGGAFVCELGAEQGAAALALAERSGLIDLAVLADLSGRDRVLRACRPA